ncbi:MAG: alkaline phosphatase family protein [Thermotogota bacterium]|nr:alkaline phosphatase family protein [Thermotogota bacterium]
MSNKKVMVIGLDGATWDLMRPLAEKGILPTFKKLMEKSVYGDLESTVPPITIPAWISFVTGKNPGKLGCYDFLVARNSLNDLRPITTKDIQAKTFYEILNENKKKCILINLPGSYPPRIKEIVITSLMTQGENFIFPPELLDEISDLKNYRIIYDIPPVECKNLTNFFKDVREVERNRFKCAKKLFVKEWDLFFLLFSGTDGIQHRIYSTLLSETIDINSDPIKFYKEIDGYVKWFVENSPKDTNILIMSDHGFVGYKNAFFINEWLKKRGYLKLRVKPKNSPGEIEQLSKAKNKKKNLGIKLPPILLDFLKSLNWLYPIYRKLSKVLPIEIQATIQSESSGTIAYSISHADTNFGGIHINSKKRFSDGIIIQEDYENVRNEIICELKKLKDPETGKKVIINVWKKEDIYHGSQLRDAPDIIFVLPNKYQVKSSVSSNKIFNNNTSVFYSRCNNHALQGIFLAHGPDIKKGVEIQNAKIIDLAPTILHLFGMPIPEDMDGKILKEIFKEDGELAKREIKYQKTGKKENVKGKIKELKNAGKI